MNAATHIPEGLEPVAVWNASTADWTRQWTHGQIEQITWWIRTYLGVCPNDTYRVEFYLLDSPFAVVHRYQVNGKGP